MDQVHISESTMVGIWYAAKKYMINSLEIKCKEFIEQHINPISVFTILDELMDLDENQLVKQALEYIDNHTEQLLKSSAFKQISHSSLCTILERESLSAEEVTIFRACLEWAGAKCLEEGASVSLAGIRHSLGKALYLIRFPVMDISDFSNSAATEGLLSEKEVNQVFLQLTKETPPSNIDFPTKKRYNAGQKIVMVNGMVESPAGNPFTTLVGPRIAPNKGSVLLSGIYFAYTDDETLGKISVQIKCTDSDTVTADSIIKISKANPKLFNAKAIFNTPVPLPSRYWSSIIFCFSSTVNPEQIIFFTGSPTMNGFQFDAKHFFLFTGLSYK